MVEQSEKRVCVSSFDGIPILNPVGSMDVCLLLVSCVDRWRSLRWADSLSRRVIPSGMCYCVWHTNLKNEAALIHAKFLHLTRNSTFGFKGNCMNSVFVWAKSVSNKSCRQKLHSLYPEIFFFVSHAFRNNKENNIFMLCHLTTQPMDWFWSSWTLKSLVCFSVCL